MAMNRTIFATHQAFKNSFPNLPAELGSNASVLSALSPPMNFWRPTGSLALIHVTVEILHDPMSEYAYIYICVCTYVCK